MEAALEKLVRACDVYDLHYVKECMAACVAQGVDISLPVKKKTALMHACHRRHLEMVEYLLAHGADVNIHGLYGWTALHRAMHDKEISLDIVRLLLAHGADVMATEEEDGETPFHTALSKEFNRELIEILIEAGADLTARVTMGRLVRHTALHYACWFSNLEAVKFLVARGVDVDPRDGEGKTPLRFTAVSHSKFNLPLIEFLLQHGADPNSIDDEGNSIVWMHVYDDEVNVDVLRLLLDYGLEIRPTRTSEKSILHQMAWSLRTPSGAFDILIERGFQINALNKNGETPLHVVCSRDWLGVNNVECLLS